MDLPKGGTQCTAQPCPDFSEQNASFYRRHAALRLGENVKVNIRRKRKNCLQKKEKDEGKRVQLREERKEQEKEGRARDVAQW